MFNNVVVIPSYRPDVRLTEVVDGVMELRKEDTEIVIVDDGSGPQYRAIFDALSEKDRCTVLRHDKNWGKGAALKTAFTYLIENGGANAVVTADADGQHSPRDIVRVAESLAPGGSSIVLGMRDFSKPNVPLRSKLGNRSTSAFFKLLYGVYLEDTQTGLRGFAGSELDWLSKVHGDRFEYEINVLISAVRNHIDISRVDIETVYYNNNSGSHYSTFKDSTRVFCCLVSGFFRYSLSSLVSAALDVTVFTIINILLRDRLDEWSRFLVATLVARVCSSIVNYSVNRKIIFKSNSKKRNTMYRYYILWTCQLAASYGMILLLSSLFPAANQTLLKMAVDLTLSIMSYQVQMHWVFKNKR